MASSGPEKADCSQIISSTSPGGVPGDSGGSSTRPTLKITLLGSEWNSSAGGLSTFNRELAIHLSEHPQVDVTLLVPEGACKDEEKNEARRYGVNVVDAKFQAGFDPLYWLSCPPKDLHIDIVIGHGIKLGPQVQIIRNCVQFSTCKWVQVVHTAPEDLSKFKNYSDPTSKGETKYQVEIDLCKRADLVVPVGPRLTKSYSGKLRRWKKEIDIFTFTPGLFEREFGDLEQVANNNEDFKVLIVGRGDTEDFELKGLDIAAKAFADKRLKHKPYELTFVGAPEGKQEEVRERLLRCGIAKEQLTVRRFVQSRDRLKDLLCEADLAIMPSKSEGFGLVAVEALSAGLPILVGSRSGFAKALEVVVHGHSCVVHSDDPAKWAEAIEAVRDRHGMRLKEIQALKASYGEMYSWKEQCEALVQRMWQIVPGNENRNISKCRTPVEKHDGACKTSEKRRHSVDEKRKTLGTDKAESSPRKEPPKKVFRPSHLESTPDPGFVSASLGLVITAQDLDVKQQEFIDGNLKSQIQAYTTYHDLSTPGSVGAFIEHVTKVYNLAVKAVKSGSLILTVQCFTLEGLEMLWNDYRSGRLNDIAERFLVTGELKRKLNLENFRLTITIEEENYLICKKTLMEKIESVGSIEGTEEDDEPAGDRGADWKTSTESSKNRLAECESKNGDAISPGFSTKDGKSSRDGKPDQSESANGVGAQLGGSGAGCIKKTDPHKGTESSKGSLAEGESKNGDAISPVISTNDGKSSRDGKPDQSESANGVEAQLGGSGAGSIKKTDPYEGTGAIPKRPNQGNSRKPETSISKDPWTEETGETEILPVQETSNVLSKCDFRLEKHEAAAKTSVQNPVRNQKRTALGRNEDKTSSSTKLSTSWCKPSMSGSTAPDQVSTVSGKMPTFAKKNPIETMDEMKSGVKEEITRRKRTPDSSAGQAFSVLSEAKGEDVRRRGELIKFYTTAETILDKMHEKMITLLQKHTPNVKEDMKLHIKQLMNEEYYLLFAGETSSGKSRLINLILGEEILPYSHQSCTSTICELKFGDERRLVVHFKDKDHPETELPTEEILLAQPTESFSYLDQIFPYVHVKNDSGNKGSVVKKVELFWPHSLLQTGLVMIDSPGVGESDEMDKMVVQYLPKAFAFVYVINSANAGGIQKDRLEKLLLMARDMSLGDPYQERKEGGLTSVIEEDPLSKCTLFVCNKWEQVPEQEVQLVKDYTVNRLGKVWPGIDPKSQVTYLSTTRALTAQNLGVITKEFSSVMDRIKSVILMSIEAKLELHWNWLHRFLTTIVIHAKVFLENASNTHDDINQKMEKVIHRLDVMKKGQKKVFEDLQASFNEKVDTIFYHLSEYLFSEDVTARFTSWSENEFPDQYISALTQEVEEKIDTLLSSRFQEVVKQWEEENHVFADARLSLLKKVKNCYDEAEFKRRNLLFDATDVHHGVSNFKKFRFSIPRKAYMKIRTLTFGVFGLVADSMDGKFITELYGGSKIDFKDVITQASVKFFSSRREKKQLKKFVVDKLNDVKDCLRQIEVRLPELIEEDRELYSELYGQLLCNLEQETHLQEEKKDRYRRIRDEGSQCRDQLALFGIKNVCTTKINHDELEWKEEKSSLLGSGSFSAVYQGTMRRYGEVATVALKVFNEALNADNASEIMQEMKILRILKHPHIVQFYGIYLDMSSPMSTRVIFVMEKCKGNLRNHIFRELESTPGRSENATTVEEVCHWLKQIIDGLAHIHELGVVHRDLKLENILLSDDNTVKIADVGLAKAEIDITGIFAGTPVYMAPEVFHSQKYGTEADIYSLGLIMWEMWYGQRAFADAPGTTPQALFDWVDDGNRPVHKQGCKTPPYFWERLMTQCWDGDPDKRPTAKECQEWQFVTKSVTRV